MNRREHAQGIAEEKCHKRMEEISRKQLRMAPHATTPLPRPNPIRKPYKGAQKPAGKYSRLRHELTLAIRLMHLQPVCDVTVLDNDEQTDNEGSESGRCYTQTSTPVVDNFHVVAAHIEGDDGSESFLGPNTVMQAM